MMVMAYSKKPAPAVAVMAHCKGLPVRIVISKNPPEIAKMGNKSGFKLLDAEGARVLGSILKTSRGLQL